MNWRERIVIDPAIHHGDPCIKGTRIPVSFIAGSIADGDTDGGILPHRVTSAANLMESGAFDWCCFRNANMEQCFESSMVTYLDDSSVRDRDLHDAV